jgi:putative ABC transport system ATP-binding protein
LLVSVENLKFRYSTDNSSMLDIPAWSLEPGEQVFLYGPSGTGKSTFLNLLAGILLPNTGEICVLGKRLNTLSGRQRDKWRAQHIGVVFQQFNLIPYLDAVSNIALAAHFAGTKKTKHRALELLNALGIDQNLHNQAASRLSIGQQQRVAIARALVNSPELLIVDEPTSALDQQNRDVFMSLLFDQAKLHQTALVFVSHDLALADAFHRVEALADLNQAQDKY